MSEWCFQCGVESKPERAIGWDEDGEPACALHSIKAKKPLNVAEKSSPNIPAAPSPVQHTKEKIMAYNEKKCLGCGQEFIPSGARSERCEECRKTRIAERAKNYRAATTAVTLKPAKKPRKTSAGVYDRALNDLTDAIVGSGSAESVFGANRFTAGQLDKLWALFSPATKAEAIDRLLSYATL